MVHQRDVGAGPAHPERHFERVEHQRGAHVLRQLPANYHAAEGVDDEGEEQDSLPAAQVGEVGDPQLVGSAGGEVAVDQIRSPVRLGVWFGGPPRLAAPLGAGDPRRAHQPSHPVAPGILALALERPPYPPVPIGLIVGPVQLPDPL